MADCIPSCVGKACGEDGCGGSCGTCTGAQESCVQGTCVCQGACTGKACGPDGCGGSCGDCLDCDGHAADYLCTAAGTCIDPCCPSCAGKACGADDGCAGACIGTCPTGQSCINYACVPNCVPSCTGKECGGNGCGGSCGTCPAGLQCLASGQCQTVCDLACTGKACGSDGCGGFCGFCPAGKVCTDGGQCVTTCTPSCTGKACGSNGCGGTCGSCSTGLFCSAAGQCVASCTPSCAFKECGPNGCGGSCGACAGSLLCTAAGQCGSVCTQCIDDPSCADLDFSSGSLGSWAIDAAQVVPSFGSTQPLSGGHMLKLTTGEGLTEADSEAVFQTCLPPGAYVAASDWRIYSAEFTEWCGSQFQDSFHAWLTVGGQFVELAHTSIDDLCPPDECTGCGGQYVGLEPAELSLDQDGVYKTPWFQVAAPVTVSAPGQILELHLEATDAGDTIFDSVLLVDRVRFIPCADWCQEVGQACGPSPCGDSCGSCTGPQQQCVGGQCVCVPQCLSKQCGDDGCGGTCGTCTGIQQQCVAGKCVCIPACQGKQCGTDGCGGSCGSCNDFLPCTIDTCVSGQCTHVDQGCCATDADCNDGNVCTIDDCVDTFCQWSPSGDPACCEPVEYEETFGDGVGQGWTASANIGNVGWWVWLNPPTGGSAALYYGNPSVGNYQSTAVNQGTITTPTVALDPGRAWSVAFDAYLDVETSASYDKLTFWVSWDGGPWVLLWDKSDYGTMKTWKAVSLDISPLAGASVQFMFRFESVNTYYNSTLGVLVDDFRLETTCAAPACLTEGDCASDVPGAADSCVAKICQWVLPVTCASTAACADGSECTTDLCVNGICSWQEIEDCCEFDADCADGDPCTQDTCVDFIFLTYCDNAPIAGCCNTSQDCNDNNVCTTDSCPQPGAQCAHGQVQGCCNTAAECGDGDPCTQDVCAGHQCTHTNICCQTAAQCNDGNPCTQDACVQGFCSNTWVGGEGCCAAVYFRDDFGTNLGWQYGSNWQRGLATASGGNNNPDPAND
ncbi:MAG: hypothetical protein FJ098_09415, partial [Deltaproteobacteria bacterium]|nr:hypothetical protein [Deltaproteobacteria bacterium]